MDFGLIHYNTPGDTLEEFLDYVKETGFHFIEVQMDDIWPKGETNPEAQAERMRAQLEARGLAASALETANDFVVLVEEEVEFQVNRMRRVCKLAQILGTDMLRTEGGFPKESVPESKWAEAITGCLLRCRDFIEPMGMKLAIDNHGTITNNAELQLEVIKRVNSPSVGLNLDTMNYRWFGHDLETIDRYFEMIAGHVLHTHLKDGFGSLNDYVGTVLGEGEIHLDHAVSCLKRAGYRGVWCAEYEGPKDQAAEGYRKCLDWMRQHITTRDQQGLGTGG